MKLKNTEIKDLVSEIGFKPQDGDKDIYFKTYSNQNDYVLKINFEQEKIEYGTKIKIGDLTTSNFESSENFVVLECVDRVLEKGYSPDRLSLEHKWPMGRKEKGKLDILITDKDDNTYLMIECKTWGEEYEKEKKKMQRDGGQLFSYFQQDKAAQYICLYASRIVKGHIEYVNDIIKVDEQWKELNNQKEIFDHWNKNFKDNGIFDDWANAYDVEIKALTRSRLKELNSDDSGRIFNQFAEILRHNVVSDKPNAFNKILNLFICKIIDEDRNDNEEVFFQWLEEDTHEKLQTRLNDLYKDGMKRFLDIEVTDYTDLQLENKLYNINEPEVKKQIQEMFQHLRLQKNPEFAFKEVYNEKSFYDNAHVVKEVVELLQPFRFRYGHKQQFLGDFFELLLSTSIKQEAGQFFTPVPVAKFIVSCFPIREFINKKVQNNEADILPTAIDYATGSGHFLTEWMDELQHIINGIDTEKIRPTAQRRIDGWKLNQFEWAKEFVYGIEADYRLVKTTKVSSFLNGDGEAIIIRADGLDNFQKSTDYKGKLKEVSQENSKDNAQFDILIANPPYSVSAFKNTLKFGNESFELYDRLTDDSSEIECLFIERTKQLLKIGGWAGIILPSSILSNSGIYTDAREIILKYFDLKAIAEFGSNTFMATGTNTVALFLERKSNNEWKKIETAIKTFFDKPKEATVNGIENAFSKYATEVYENLELADYITLVNKKPNENVKNKELFGEYLSWFHSLTEVKQLKEKKAFKEKTEVEKKTELDKLFYDKVFTREQDRILYYFLAYPQQTVLIKVGEKQAEKDFIGYEFSSRRGHEGIKLYRDETGKPTTKLYDEQNYINPEKANSYVYRAFLNEKLEIDESLQENITVLNTLELIDFKKLAFEKSISLGIKKKMNFDSKYNLVKLSNILSVLESGNRPKGGVGKFRKGIPSIGGEHIGIYGDLNLDSIKYVPEEFFNQSNRGIIQSNDILICKDGALTGKVAIVPKSMPFEKAMINEHVFLLRTNEQTNQEYLFHFLYSAFGQVLLKSNITGQAQGGLNSTNLENIKIPLPPKDIQEQIIKEIGKLEEKENAGKHRIEKLKQEIVQLFSTNSSNSVIKKLEEVCDMKAGKFVSSNDIFSKSDNDLFPCYGGNGQRGYTKTYTHIGKYSLIGRQGALCGNVHLVEGQFHATEHALVVTPLADTNIDWLFYLLKSLDLNKYATGTAQPGLSVKNINSIPVSVLPFREQENLVSELNKLETEISNIEIELKNIDSEKEQILKNYLE